MVISEKSLIMISSTPVLILRLQLKNQIFKMIFFCIPLLGMTTQLQRMDSPLIDFSFLMIISSS